MSQTISPEQIAALDSPYDLVDVRTPAEFRALHASPAINHPLDSLDPQALLADRRAPETPLYVICASGQRGGMACKRLAEGGLQAVINVEGGTKAWAAAGLPVTRGKAVMSLERQVRIAAGSLVAIGAGLGAFVHPGWIGLAAFVGLGLVFAGITNTCGMGMLISKMPWNR